MVARRPLPRAWARAMMRGTKTLLPDEPFECLSPAMGDKLARTIQEIQRDGISILMAQSDERRIKFAERVYTIERGEIIEKTEAA